MDSKSVQELASKLFGKQTIVEVVKVTGRRVRYHYRAEVRVNGRMLMEAVGTSEERALGQIAGSLTYVAQTN